MRSKEILFVLFLGCLAALGRGVEAADEGIFASDTGICIKTSTPNSTLQVAGSVAYGTATFSSGNFNAGDQRTILANSASGNLTVNLPSPSGNAGREYLIKKTTASNKVSVVGSVIDSGNTVTLTATSSTNVLPFVSVVSSGNSWLLTGMDGGAISTTGTGNSSLSDGLKLHYKFNESSGTSAADDSGQGNTGTLIGGFTFGGNGSLNFDGVDDNVNAGHSTSLDATNTTLSAWIYARSYGLDNGEQRNYLSKRSSSGTGSSQAYELQIHYITGELYLEWESSGWRAQSDSSGAIATNTWIHAVLTVDGTSYKFYRNGVMGGNGTLSAGFATNNHDVRVGGMFDGGSLANWDGLLDEVRIYNRALSASEVQSLYNLGH